MPHASCSWAGSYNPCAGGNPFFVSFGFMASILVRPRERTTPHFLSIAPPAISTTQTFDAPNEKIWASQLVQNRQIHAGLDQKIQLRNLPHRLVYRRRFARFKRNNKRQTGLQIPR